MYYFSSRPWRNYDKCYVNLRPARKQWVLGIHPDKTKILSNQHKEKAKEITVATTSKSRSCQKETVRDILGKKKTFEDQETEEIKNRLKAGWAAFQKYRQELTSKDYRLCHRLRLFSMVITSTVTYAGGTWTLSQKHERMIKTAQRKMLRLIVQNERENTNQKKIAANKTAGETKEYTSTQKKKTSMRPTKKLKRAHIKTPTKIKTVKCPSKRK